jgi:hypothetical protein
MFEFDRLSELKASPRALARPEFAASRRSLILAPLISAFPAILATLAQAGEINPAETQVTLPDAIKWSSWLPGFPPDSAQMATFYGGLDKPGPYVVFMKWYPGYMSAPHTYATDRLSVVISGTWWVNSGADFDPANAVPVPAGGFVRRVAHTPHYDGVVPTGKEPVVIALFGIAPVDFQLVDASKPAWRKVS